MIMRYGILLLLRREVSGNLLSSMFEVNDYFKPKNSDLRSTLFVLMFASGT